MYELVIFTQFDPLAKMKDKVLPGDFRYNAMYRAEERAVKYLQSCPNDIVMVVETNNGV